MSQSFVVNLYGPGLPLVGVKAQAHFRANRLHANEHEVEISAIESRVGGFEHSDLFLQWQDENGEQWAINPVSKADLEILLNTAPDVLKPQLGKWRKRRHSINLVWGTIGSVTAAFLLSFVLLWAYSEETVSWLADQVSVDKELQLGNSVLEQVKAEGDVIEQGLAVKTVQDIGNRLTKGSRYHYQWLIKKDKTLNAFALPGGIVIVHSALIEKTDNADELAAVLAHEVQHIEQRHALKNMIKSVGWAAALMVVLGDVNTATAVIIHQVGNMYFSRDLEDEADRLGFKALITAKINPAGMPTLFKKLEKEQQINIPAWISSHPATGERIKTIEKMIKEQPCPDCQSLALDWKKVQQDKSLNSGK
jgi:Zn-dependent protease with chaperone function